MSNLHGIIFGYDSGTNLRELTEQRTAASLPFGGRYRIIDFLLSTMVNAGVDDVGIILQESYQSLLDHVRGGRDWDLSRLEGGLTLLPPFSTSRQRGAGFAGTMDALLNVRSYIEEITKDYVFLANGNIITSFDLSAVLNNHIESGADITAICVREEDNAEMRSVVRLLVREDGFAQDMVLGSNLKEGLIATDMYLISTKVLKTLMDECANSGESSLTRAIQSHVGDLRVMNYVIKDYIARPFTVLQYYQQSMQLLDSEVRHSLFPKGRPVLTKRRNDAPTYYAPGVVVKNSIVADGCYIEGDVENSIIFRGVRIAPGAKVKGCIVMQDTEIGPDAVLDCVITDKDVTITRGRTFIGNPNYPTVVAKGTVV